MHVVLQSTVVPSRTVTVEPASQVPLMSGVLSWTVLPCAGPSIVGAAGADVSTINMSVASADGLPPLSVCDAVIVCAPSGRVVDVHVKVPVALQVAVHNVVVPWRTVTVAPASHVPVMSGVLSLVLLPMTGAVIVGAAGAAVSTVKVFGCDGSETLPAASVWVAVSV